MIHEPYFQAKMSLKLDDFEGWITGFVEVQKEWINFDIKESQSGNLYAEVNTWEPEKQDESPRRAEERLNAKVDERLSPMVWFISQRPSCPASFQCGAFL